VVNGITDLYVEHRGAGPAVQLPRDLMLGELRQVGATKVTTSHHGTVSCHTIYQIFEKHLTSVCTDKRHKAAIAVKEATRLCFTITGEQDEYLYPYHVGVRSSEASVGPKKGSTGDLTEIPSCQSCVVAAMSESLLMPSVVSAGITVVDHSGFPLHYDNSGSLTGECPVNVVTRSGIDTARGSDLKLAKGAGCNPTPAVSSTRVEFPGQQHNLRTQIVSKLPEHLRCVLPPEQDDKPTLSLAQLEEAVKLILKYEDCFVGASGKVGWTDMATHSIDTGVGRPVKQPPRRTSFEEKDQ